MFLPIFFMLISGFIYFLLFQKMKNEEVKNAPYFPLFILFLQYNLLFYIPLQSLAKENLVDWIGIWFFFSIYFSLYLAPIFAFSYAFFYFFHRNKSIFHRMTFYLSFVYLIFWISFYFINI